MKFVVTAVSDEEIAQSLRISTCRLQDWFNAALADADFGGNLDQVTIVVVSVDEDTTENARWARPHNRLGSFKNPVSSERVRYLSIAVLLQPSVGLSKSPGELLAELASLIREALTNRPARLPAGFSYDRFSLAASTALLAYQDAP